MTLEIDFCGELLSLAPGGSATIGREGDLVVDDNPYLHRHFLQIVSSDGIWWLVNLGDQLSATVSAGSGRLQAWLSPGARLPIVFERTTVRFAAGSTSYEFEIISSDAQFTAPGLPPEPASGETTIGRVAMTPSQHLLIVALAEPILRQEGRGTSAVPSSADAAQRLGWPITTFNRKLDNVCDKLDRRGVRGLKGRAGELASGRRARLVEYALAVGLVSPEDLALLDHGSADKAQLS